MIMMNVKSEEMSTIENVMFKFDKFNVGGTEWFSNYSKKRQAAFADQLQRLKKIIPKDKANIIDFGASPFVLAEAFSILGHHVTAVDIFPDRYENLEKLSCVVN